MQSRENIRHPQNTDAAHQHRQGPDEKQFTLILLQDVIPIIEQFTVKFRGIVCPPNPLKFVPHILKSNLQR